MKKLNIIINIEKLKLSDAEKQHLETYGFSGMFESILIQGLSSKYRDGLGGLKQRILNRILDKLDLSISGEVELEEGEFDLIKDVFLDESVKFQPSQARLVCQYMDKIEKLLS